ncbi:hypothetical protein EXS73_02260 [Candidatus Pacearchaeota archaeon]|nr:hypothetical protein [Candidatus Pacearchaeota archaeon]
MGESVDVIDYTLLRKKGILQRAHGLSSSHSPSSSVSPLSAYSSNPLASFLPPSEPTIASSASSPSSAPVGGFFGFMDAPPSPSPPSLSSPPDASSVSALHIKVDDLDYKLGKLTEQLALLEAKLGLLSGSS